MAIISGSDLASWLSIPDTEDDPALQTAAAAASQKVTEYCDRDFVKTAIASPTARVFWPTMSLTGKLEVDDFWETTVLVVKVDDNNDGTFETTLTLNTDFYLEPLNGRLHGQTWPYTRLVLINRTFPCYSYRPSVQVTAAWGWTAIPDAVKQATLIEGAAIFHRRNSPSGVIGGFADFGAVRVSRFEDPDVARYLFDFRKSDPAVYVG